MQSITKLELTWIGKSNQIKPEPRILLERADLSNTDKDPATQNILIHGDNLLALKSLEQEFAGRIKCIYIDPPYNTGAAFEHYDDNLEHSTWLSLMKPRLEILRNLLSKDGNIWISIDSYESHYLKVLCDEVFGRRNFIDEVIWQRAYSPINLKKTLSKSHDSCLVYAKEMTEHFFLNKLPRTDEATARYKNPDNDPRGVWKSSDMSVGPVVKEKLYEITLPSGRIVTPPKGRCWLYTKERYAEMLADNRIYFGDGGNSVPAVKKFLTEVRDGIVAQTLWTHQEVGHNQDAKREIKELFPDDVFETPKPERLIERILQLGSNPGDLVLDSFLGSGTTAAVAHKMGRKWIGVELGDHAYTHCKVRMDKVIDGEQGGISKSVGWNGGGGYRFYKLASSLINLDKFGMPVISNEYNAEMLAAAICKHEGYTYSPDQLNPYKQGFCSDKNFIFTTTSALTIDYLDGIASEFAKDENLIVFATHYEQACKGRHKNIIVNRIPQVLLGRCEFGKSDYNLNVIESIVAEVNDE